MTTTLETTPNYPSTKPAAAANAPTNHLAKSTTEAIGTMFLVFTIGCAVRSGSPLAPLAIGAVLMAMIYAGGHISGAHYNPAVTVAALVRGRIAIREAAGY